MLLCWVRVLWVGKLRSNTLAGEMRKSFFPLIVAVIALLCLASCNKVPRHYQMVQNMSDGKQVVDTFDAENDTVALNMYLDRMSNIIIQNMNKNDSTAAKIESMYVLSPEGDTLNTNPELMDAIERQFQ